MKINDLLKMYEKYQERYGANAYKQISKLLAEAKTIHIEDFLNSSKAKKIIEQGRRPDPEQSWKGFKGNALESLVLHIINDEIDKLGLKIVKGKKFERTKPENLSTELKHVKKNLSIDFGQFGFHIPDVDLVIYDPQTYRVIAVLSSKVTLRERIAQTAYWNIKMKNYELTNHIKVYFISPDEDGTLTIKNPPKKGRAIVETDTDGSYLLTESIVEESDKVKNFDKFINDLKNLIS